ncbi:MAG: Gfo/Idh/MocA family oxidoreductase, partial [Verrucomicrobiota bacterium]|nr:Gfo/Idh/MocA family oxidoreductase [Verrucomicrobiota bacterium]
MKKIPTKGTRRSFLNKSATGATAATILPRHIFGAPHVPPSEKYGTALIGCGGRGPGTYSQLCKGLDVELVGACDVNIDKAKRFSQARSKGKAESYQDFRKLLERKDLDLVAIATPPHWHAYISISCAEAGMDVLCEKPMTRFVAEGRAVVNAFKRYDRVFQIGTFGRFGRSKDKGSVLKHKIMASGLLKNCQAVRLKKGGLKIKQWSGTPGIPPETVPSQLDWDLYCGPSPWKPYESRRTGGTHRGYWDYEGGGMCDMGQHHYDPEQWTYAKDYTSPVEITPFAPPSHPEVSGMWAWVELKYADGFKFVMQSNEWGPTYT